MDAIEPDGKDWTWVLDRPCPECGFVAAEVEGVELGEQIRRNAASWALLLAAPGATTRPDPTTWSPAEYAAHVRDVHRVMAGRLSLMLAQDDPIFANWDQDATAVSAAYLDLDPAAVAAQLVDAVEPVAARFESVTAWDRTGNRSDGARFTVDSFARYFLHDPVHHLWDVNRLPPGGAAT